MAMSMMTMTMTMTMIDCDGAGCDGAGARLFCVVCVMQVRCAETIFSHFGGMP